jgi:hypothetical protein
MNTLEDRVRAALGAHAADFTASPDAWEKLRARGTFRSRPARTSRWVRVAVPVTAAAAVVAVVVAVTVTVHAISNWVKPVTAATGTAPAGPLPGGLTGSGQLQWFPPSSTILQLKLAQGASQAIAYLWLSDGSPAYWQHWIVSGPQLCQWAVNDTPGDLAGNGSGSCKPLPRLTGNHLASITGSDQVGFGQHSLNAGGSQPILTGVAAGQVTSVAAVLPGGRAYDGTVGTGRGFGEKGWAVTYPGGPGVHLVFRDGSGRAVADLPVTDPGGEPRLARPGTGGVMVFHYPSSGGIPAGWVQAYLVDGRVVFWGVLTPEVSPVPAAGGPVVGGLYYPLGSGVVAAGYAHANVARVVLRLRDGEQVAAPTLAARWPGSDLRLWTVNLPARALTKWESTGTVAATATAYGATGQVVGRVELANSTP